MNLRVSCCCVLCALLAAIAGCGSDRVEISGVVKANGQPLERGYISFRPQTGTAGPTAGAEIAAGQFQIPAEQGVLPGMFRVEITASRKTGKQIADDMTGGTVADVYEQYLPARYNTASELTAEVRAGERNPLEFDLAVE